MRTATSKFQYVMIEGQGYVVDSLHERLWDVDEKSGRIEQHHVSVSEYRNRGIPVIAAHPTIVGGIFSDFERVLDAESQFCLRWLREYGHEPGPYESADATARDCSTSIEALRDKHRLIKIVDGQVQLLEIGDYHHSRRKLSYDLTAWEVCFWTARHSVESSEFDQQNTTGKLKLRQHIRDGNRVAGNLVPSRGSVETLTLLLADAYNGRGSYVTATIFEGLLRPRFQ